MQCYLVRADAYVIVYWYNFLNLMSLILNEYIGKDIYEKMPEQGIFSYTELERSAVEMRSCRQIFCQRI